MEYDCSCQYCFISLKNGYPYCSHPITKKLGYTPYCIKATKNPMGFVCPLGIARVIKQSVLEV